MRYNVTFIVGVRDIFLACDNEKRNFFELAAQYCSRELMHHLLHKLPSDMAVVMILKPGCLPLHRAANNADEEVILELASFLQEKLSPNLGKYAFSDSIT